MAVLYGPQGEPLGFIQAPDDYEPEGQMLQKADHVGTGEIGTTGLRQFGGFVLEEWLTNLQGRRAAWVWREMMDNSPVVGSILYAIEWLVRGLQYRVEPGNSQSDADFIESCMHDMSEPWETTISEALSCLPYGWSYHELVYKYRNGPQGGDSSRAVPGEPSMTVGLPVDSTEENTNRASSQFKDGKVGWRKIPGRAQETLMRWWFDGYSGIRAMEQIDWHGGNHVMPIEKSLLFRFRPRRNNPEGYSMLRTAYVPYFALKNIMQIESIGIERDLAGIPVLTPPPGVDIFAPGSAKLLAICQELVTGIKRDEDSGVILPTADWKLELINSGGSRQIDTDDVVRRYEARIATSMLADFVLVGQDSVGSYAMVDIKSDLFGVALDGIVDMVLEVFNRYAIPRLLRLNGMDASDPPKIVHSSAGRIALEKVGTFLQSLALAGAPIPWSVELLRDLFMSAGLPANFEEHDKPEVLPTLPRPLPPTEPVGSGTSAAGSGGRVVSPGGVQGSGTTAQSATRQVAKAQEQVTEAVRNLSDVLKDAGPDEINAALQKAMQQQDAVNVALQKAQTPPNLRTTDSETMNCHTCAFMDPASGMCLRYELPVTSNEVCDSWTDDNGYAHYVLSILPDVQKADRKRAVEVGPGLRNRAQALSAQLEREIQAALAELGTRAGAAYDTFVHKAARPNIQRIVSRVLTALNIREWVNLTLLPLLRNHAARTMVDTQNLIRTEIQLEVSIADSAAQKIAATAGSQLNVVDIDEQIRQTIARVIEDGFAAGESSQVTGRRIREMVPAGRFVHAGARYRANLIARNETANLQRLSTIALYQSNPNIEAVRLTDGIYGPPRSDQACIARDGQVVPIDQADSIQPYHPNCTLGVEPIVRGRLQTPVEHI